VIRTVRKDGPNKGKKFWGCRNYVVSLNVSVEFSLCYGCWYLMYISFSFSMLFLFCVQQSRDVDFGCGFFDWYSEPDNQTQMGDTQCKECSKKDMENASIRKTMMKMHEDNVSTKNNMKLMIVICLLLSVICVIFMCILVKLLM
jgi:hypothetical protein